MDRLKFARRVFRSGLTRVVNSIEAEVAKDVPDRDNLCILFERLKSNNTEISDFDSKILDAMYDANCTEEEQDDEMISIEDYNDKFNMAKLKIQKVIQPPPRSLSPSPSEHSNAPSVNNLQRNYKLPKIELVKFNGELKNWLSFWSCFEKIHEDNSLTSSDKFQYLRQSMVSGTEVREIVESFPHTPENYPKVIDTLKDQYGKESLLVQVHVRELLKLAINNVNSKDKVPLSKMYVKLESHLRALSSLKLAPTDPSTWLFPLIESSLPEETMRAWQRSTLSKRDGSTDDPKKSRLDFLMEFLKNEVEAERQIALASTGFSEQSISKDKKPAIVRKKQQALRERKELNEDDVPTAAGLHVSKINCCIFCDKNHPSQECFKAQKMSIEDKKSVVKKKRACFLCLRPGHTASDCKVFVNCSGCGKKHYHLFCPELMKNQKSKDPDKSEVETKSVNSNNVTGGLVLLKTLQVRLVTQTANMKLRVLFDDGSQKSYIKKYAAEVSKCESLGFHMERNSLFGGQLTEVEERITYKTPLQSLNGKVKRELILADKDKIAVHIPKIPQGPWIEELNRKNIYLSDLDSDAEEVDILIGSDLLPKLTTGKVQKLKCGLDAVETVFGWTLMGPVPKTNNSLAVIVTALHSAEVDCSKLWELDTIGIRDPVEVKTKQEREESVKLHFLETVAKTEEGRYAVSLPWQGGVLEIPNNKKIAEKRLLSSTQKLQKDEKIQDYSNIFESWLKEGFIEEVKCDGEKDSFCCHYLPHRPVYKPHSKTTPVRPVFDASCKIGRSPSLNDILEKGPNFIELIPSIMHRFREGKIGVISDIRKAFQMIEVCEKDRDFLRFLWWKDEACKVIRVFRHKRVVFGVNCSPFLLGAVLEYHLNGVKEDDKKVAEKLQKSFYVDNCVTSVQSREEYHVFKEKAISIMGEAKMELREWECGPVVVLGNDQSTNGRCELGAHIDFTPFDISVLGMKWNTYTDTLRCDTVPEVPEKMTKRTLLSVMQKMFDPMGFLCPVMITPKLVLQEAWVQKIEWDSEIPEDVTSHKMSAWAQELKVLEEVRVPRRIGDGNFLLKNCALHVFTDASQYAYAAVVFLRVEESDKVTVQMLQAKARISPLKKPTIPRLELLGCTIGARLGKSVQGAFSRDITTHYWSDSTTALAWIKRNDEWGTFVGNRVREICKLSNPNDWKHVPGVLNPADLPSRGCSPKDLLRSKWWEGPRWLKLSPEEWPQQDFTVDEDIVISEKRKSSVKSVLLNEFDVVEDPWYSRPFSSYSKCVRLVAYVRRFINLKLKQSYVPKKKLTIEEVEVAERTIFKLIQRKVFPKEGEVICGVHVKYFDGLFRVKTKLTNREDSIGFRFPVLLPSTHPIVEKLIREEHLKNGHAGVQFLMSKIREKVWILHSRKTIRKVVQSCTICRRFDAKATAVPEAPLPEDRVKDARVFEVTGVDLAGPLFLKDKTKVWIVLFSCAVYRGIHLELVVSLNTDTFLLALCRFIKRRGRPSIMYSDNGTNFVGSNNLFRTLDWTRIERETKVHRIQWKFNPPSAAWWGGWWERLIRTVKNLLKKMLGHEKLGYVQMETCLCEVEAVVNARPLTYITEDEDDLVPLTPAMFMQDVSETSFPEVRALNGEGLRKKYKEFSKLKQELKGRFRVEYLGQLVHKGKMKNARIFSVGEVVLVASDDKKRLHWPMAKILELIPGKDGNVRVARVKTANGEFLRPLQRLIPLEVKSNTPCLPITPKIKKKAMSIKKKATEEKVAEPEVVTRAGRRIKKPTRLSV